MKKRQTRQPETDWHETLKQQYDEVQIDGRYEEGMARMSLYHRHCQDPVIFQALGNIRDKALIDLACGDGFYTRKFRTECGASPVIGVDLSPKAIERARVIEQADPRGIEYRTGNVVSLELARHFDIATAIHLLHYLQNAREIESALAAVHDLLRSRGLFVTMMANPEFDLERHDASDSKAKFGYYFSLAEPGNGGLMRFHPGGFEKERELTLEFRRWERDFINDIAHAVGFEPEWHDPFIDGVGLEKYGKSFFENYLSNPQSKLLRLIKRR